MKTFVIRVERHDDVLSVCDRMNWAQAQRIILVLRPRSPKFTDLELTRLSRHAQSLGTQLALITRDWGIKRRCQAVGIATFETLAMAQRGRWHQRRLRGRWLGGYLRGKENSVRLECGSARALNPGAPRQRTLTWPWRVGFFLLGVLAVLTLMMSLFPSASLIINLPRQKQSLRINVQTSSLASQVRSSGVLPCHLLQVDMEGKTEDTTSGMVMWPTASAQATLVIENLSEQPWRIPSGTIFMTSEANPIRFVSQEESWVPAGMGSKISVSVRAVSSGRAGNVPAGAINQIDGILNTWLRVYNPEAAQGGEEQRVASVAAQDVQRLRARLVDRLQRDAIAALSTQVGSGERLLEKTVVYQETIEEHIFPDIGLPATRVSLRTRARFRGCAVREGDLRRLVQIPLDLQVPEGYRPTGALTVQVLDAAWISQDEVLLTLLADRTLVPQVNRESLAALVTGKEPAWVVKEMPKVLNLNADVTVRVFPSWWPRMPLLPMRIQVEYQ